jgi:hypothetical protein
MMVWKICRKRGVRRESVVGKRAAFTLSHNMSIDVVKLLAILAILLPQIIAWAIVETVRAK